MEDLEYGIYSLLLKILNESCLSKTNSCNQKFLLGFKSNELLSHTSANTAIPIVSLLRYMLQM